MLLPLLCLLLLLHLLLMQLQLPLLGLLLCQLLLLCLLSLLLRLLLLLLLLLLPQCLHLTPLLLVGLHRSGPLLDGLLRTQVRRGVKGACPSLRQTTSTTDTSQATITVTGRAADPSAVCAHIQARLVSWVTNL